MYLLEWNEVEPATPYLECRESLTCNDRNGGTSVQADLLCEQRSNEMGEAVC